MPSTERQWRRNFRTGTVFPEARVELHTIKYWDDWNAYGIQLEEGIRLASPSSVAIVETSPGSTTFTEVPRNTSPGPTQFVVDYDAETYTGTSRIEFHPSTVGKVVQVSYEGLGLITTTTNFVSFLSGKTIPGNFAVAGNARLALPTTQTFSSAGNETLDCATKSLFLKTGGGASTITLTLSNMTEGQIINVIVSSGASSYSLVWAGQTFVWRNGGVPAPTSDPGEYEVYSFQKIGGLVFACRVGIFS